MALVSIASALALLALAWWKVRRRVPAQRQESLLDVGAASVEQMRRAYAPPPTGSEALDKALADAPNLFAEHRRREALLRQYRARESESDGSE